MNRIEDLVREVKRLSPWYQRIEFASGLFTTDEPGSWYQDAAWDNVIDEVSLTDACRLRPEPKWRYIEGFLPSFEGRTVLEIGVNCGYFSLKFCKKAKTVYGVDVSAHWLERANFLKDALNIENLVLVHADYLNIVNVDPLEMVSDEVPYDFFNSSKGGILFERNIVDVIFSSTVIDHVYFPIIFLYKMLFNASEFVVLDTPVIDQWEPVDRFNHKNFLHLGVPEDGSHHGFSATESFWRMILKRLAVSDEQVSFHKYGANNLCMVIDTRNWNPRHLGC